MASTMENKKNNKRKFVAVGLGLIGIAGLSVASAATLNVTAADEVAIGSAEFEACADSAHVDYSYDISTGLITGINVTGVVDANDANCDGATIEVELEDAGQNVVAAGAGTVAGGAFSFAPTGLEISTDLGEVTVVVR